jgi:hypothetical protein
MISAAGGSRARDREALAEGGIELLDCWKRGEKVCLVIREGGEPKRLHFNLKDYPRKIKPCAKHRKSRSLAVGGSKLIWKGTHYNAEGPLCSTTETRGIVPLAVYRIGDERGIKGPQP